MTNITEAVISYLDHIANGDGNNRLDIKAGAGEICMFTYPLEETQK